MSDDNSTMGSNRDAEDCLHLDVEAYELSEEDPGPRSGWHEVKAECLNCGRRMTCVIEWGTLQADVKDVSGPNAER